MSPTRSYALMASEQGALKGSMIMNVSAIIPTYRRIDDLSELLPNLLTQTFKPLEVIVVDDTPDDTLKLLCEKNKRVYEKEGSQLIYVKNARERSLTVSRNIGVGLATGELIMFLDSDVVLQPNYIEKIIDVFDKYPTALGVQGWIRNQENRFSSFLADILNRVFHLGYPTKDSCKFFEYPAVLTKVVNCERLSGSNMTFRREVFSEFKFDECLKKYAYMEDVLFSHSVYKKYPGRLFITPYASCIHKISETGRIDTKELRRLNAQYSKYVLIRLFGLNGAFLYIWQNLGGIIKMKTRPLFAKSKKR